MGEATTAANGKKITLTSNGSNAHYDSKADPDTTLDSVHRISQ